ncbi:Hypothetical protein PBC10988_11560 [Planctomycetales bacterium 10988]|nr:Hypothetical protein PBC10988_11560 [Planctomycetales bacterium 10988]
MFVQNKTRKGVCFLNVILISLVILGCHSMGKMKETSSSLPTSYATHRGPIVFYSDGPLPKETAMLAELEALQSQLEKELAFQKSSEPIWIYLFQDETRYQKFLKDHYPELPNRRAYFVQTGSRLTIYAQIGPSAGDDLRHEMTHATLHATWPMIPLWIDEGLAEFFELPPQLGGVHRQHLALLTHQLQQGTWQPNLERLMTKNELAEFGHLEYAEAWLWTHYLLRSTPKNREALQAALVRQTEITKSQDSAEAASYVVQISWSRLSESENFDQEALRHLHYLLQQ